MKSIRIVLSTAETDADAHRLAHQLVEERLAACVNIIPKVSSVYKWKGEVEEASESLLIIKTESGRLEALKARLVELHSYEVPECVVLPVEGGHQPYLDWVVKETSE